MVLCAAKVCRGAVKVVVCLGMHLLVECCSFSWHMGEGSTSTGQQSDCTAAAAHPLLVPVITLKQQPTPRLSRYYHRARLYMGTAAEAHPHLCNSDRMPSSMVRVTGSKIVSSSHPPALVSHWTARTAVPLQGRRRAHTLSLELAPSVACVP